MTRLSESAARGYGKVFDEIAAEYDRRRPAYPDELIDQACQVAGLGSGDRVLEIGCGSGQLTRGLVARDLHVTALEPGKNLLALAGRNLEGAPGLEFVNARFEDALLARDQFQAVFSASAFHWVDPKVSWQKTAEVLVPGGTLALVQYFGLEESRSKPDQDAVLAANYVRVALEDVMSAPYPGPCMHEMLFDEHFLKETGITTLDFAKAMIDEGYHPMTMYFPLVVHGAMLIEPTESESRESVDRFLHVLRRLAEEAKAGNLARFAGAPRYTPRRRMDETAAARKPVLRWHPPALAQAAE